ncbi:uncharacterized protein [Rutidosis leptorrhynchoides]|uniref:uncharacterized protein n=1 Tax=Rutidosis leptorrhynchoides TaxID=125765 RepID=UPI003A9954B0
MEIDKRGKNKLPCLFGGNGENANRKTVQPRSPSNGFTEQKLFTIEAGQTSSKQVYGIPIKALLAKEMLDETLAKKGSPSLIAKLMGLDGLPSPQPVHKQYKKSAVNSHKSNSKSNESYQLDMKTSIEQQDFKDVYEDPEASHVVNHLYSSPSFSARRRSTKHDLGYIQERYDEILCESVAIKTKLERVASNSDLMSSYLHQVQQDISFVSPYQITILKPSNYVRYRHHDKGLKEDKETSKFHVHVSHKKNENDHLGYSCHTTSNTRRSSRYRVERNNKVEISPTRIVVLKPNLAKISGDHFFVHSPDERGKNIESREVKSSRHKSKEAREIARQITSQMKERFANGNVSLFGSGYSESEMEVSSRSSFYRVDRPRRSSSNMSESDVIREAKKRMSRRWKTHGYKDVGMVGKNSSTLEEMLSVPNNVVGPVRTNDEHFRRTSRSTSLAPSLRNLNQKETNYQEAHADEKVMIESLQRGKNKALKGNYVQREDSRSRNSRYSKRCQSSQYCNTCCSPEIDNILRERRSNLVDLDELLISDVHAATKSADSVDEDSSNSQEQSTAISQGTVSVQLSGPDLEPESSEGSKEVEVDQHGRISVSEICTTEDVSSGFDCLDRVSSQLHELRKQLFMLKMESVSTYDSPNDEENEPGSSFTVTESDNWESTYITDFLQNSGFYNYDPHTFMTTWYSECPKDPWLFDQLEKIYSQDSTVSRSDRRLFHDRINEALFAIYKTVLSCLWVNPGQRGIQVALTEIGFEGQLQKVLVKQENEASEVFEEIYVDQDLDWLQPVKEIDAVGNQIADEIVIELVVEFVTG